MTSPTFQSPELLAEKAGKIEDLVRAPKSTHETKLDPAEGPLNLTERRQDWYVRLQDAVLDLSNALPQGTEDYDARKLFEYVVALGRAIADDPEVRDERGDVELALLKAGDVAARIGRRLDHDAYDAEPRQAFEFIVRSLPNVAATKLAELLNVSPKTISSWNSGGPIKRGAERVTLVAQLLTYLRPTLTPTGVVMWFEARRPQLGDATPLAVMNDDLPSSFDRLLSLARGSRAQLAG